MILLVVSLAGIFAFSLSTLGVIDPVTKAIVNSGLGEYGVLALLILMLITVGMFLDGVSIDQVDGFGGIVLGQSRAESAGDHGQAAEKGFDVHDVSCRLMFVNG